MCPPSSFLPNLKTTPQGKKNRRPVAKGSSLGSQHATSLKESVKARNKKLTLEMQSALLESSVTLSPVDSLDSPHGGANNAGYITNPTSPVAMQSPGLFHSMSVPNTPMVHNSMLEGGGPFAVTLAHINDPGVGGMSLQGRVSMASDVNHGYVLSSGQVGLNMGMVSPVSVPFDWHSRMPPSSQCGQPVMNLIQNSQVAMHPQSPAMQQQNMLIHQQQIFRNTMLQPTPVTSTPTISPVKLPSIAEQPQQQQQQQLINHVITNQQNMGRMGTSTPPTPQTSQPPPPFFQQQQQQMPQQPSQPQPPAQPPQAGSSAAQAPQALLSQPSASAAGTEDYPTPPSQHSYSSALDATPKHYLHLPSEHPYLTPSPESSEPWSSPSPHCVSDWSDSTPSPAVAGPAQTQITQIPEANGKMQMFA